VSPDDKRDDGVGKNKLLVFAAAVPAVLAGRPLSTTAIALIIVTVGPMWLLIRHRGRRVMPQRKKQAAVWAYTLAVDLTAAVLLLVPTTRDSIVHGLLGWPDHSVKIRTVVAADPAPGTGTIPFRSVRALIENPADQEKVVNTIHVRIYGVADGQCSDLETKYTVEVLNVRSRGFQPGPLKGVAVAKSSTATPAEVLVEGPRCMTPARLTAKLSVSLILAPKAITTVEVTFGDSILTIIRQPEANGWFDNADPYSAVMAVTLSDGETIRRDAEAP
jgi:hypothetical protein